MESGLESLVFDLPIDMQAPLGQVGVVHVSWTKDSEPAVTMTMTEGLALPPQIPTEALEQQGLQQGKQFLVSMLNRQIGTLLDQGVATMGGVQDGLVAVNYESPDAQTQGILSHVYLFDEDSMLKRSIVKVNAGAMGEAELTQTFAWKPAGGAQDGLVVDSESVVADFGMMQQNQQATYGYRTLGRILLPVRMSIVPEMPAMMGGGEQTRVLAAENLTVNGSAVPAEELAEPPAPAANEDESTPPGDG
jgi:hypothetical protein